MDTYLAVDVGGTQIRAAIYPSEGVHPLTVKRTTTQATTADGRGNTPLERLLWLIDSLWEAEHPPKVLVVAAPSPVNPHGVVLEAPNIPGWVNFPLKDELQKRFEVPIAIGNDANLAALGEWKFGAGQGHHHLIYLTISTGIGGGVIVNDQLLLGDNGLAGELGHITVLPDGPACGCGHYGHLEAVASGTAIARWVEEQIAQGRPTTLGNTLPITSKQVAQAALGGDALAKEAIQRAAHFLGQALADFIHIFNPSLVILGGGVAQSGALLFEPLRQSIHQHIMAPGFLERLEIAPAAFGDEAGLIGALALGRSLISSGAINK